MPWTIELIRDRHRIEEFACGEESLDRWLKQYALANTKAGLSRTFVAIEEPCPDVLGYFALSTGTVVFDAIPDRTRKRLPKYPIPTVHLGRLAVNRVAQGRGLGESLLVEALRRAAVASLEVAVYAIDVIALNPQAKAFYEKYGFTPLLDNQLHLYLPISSARIIAGIVNETD